MVRLLSGRDVAETVTMDDIVPAVEHVFEEYAEGRVIMPPKIYLDIPGHGDFRAMPAYVPSIGTAGIKWVNVHPNNPEHDLPTVMATILLNDPMTGKPIAVMDGTYITDMRTGAAGGVAAKYLAKSVATVGLIGSGHQAWTQMLAYRSVFGDKIKLVKVYSRHLRHSEALAQRIEKYLGYDAKACETPQEAADANLIATVTPARSPILQPEWVKPGTHINAIGADAPGKQELFTEPHAQGARLRGLDRAGVPFRRDQYSVEQRIARREKAGRHYRPGHCTQSPRPQRRRDHGLRLHRSEHTGYGCRTYGLRTGDEDRARD